MDILRAVRPFDMNVEENRLASEWAKWKRQLQCYFEACGIVSQTDRKAKLLFLGGPDLQELYENLPDAKRVSFALADPPYYDVAIKALDDHFEPKRMIAYERYVFRQMAQKPSERLADYVLRLRVQAKRCEFNPDNFEEMIVDQITEKCNSDALRIEILKRDKRSLGEIVALGTTMADTKAKSQQMAREIVSKEGSQVNWVGNKIMTNRQKRPVMKRGVVMSCFACGHEGHLKASKVCPAKDVRCNKCNAVGHFARCCFKQGWKLNQGNNRLPSFGKRKFESNDEAGPSKRIRSVRDEAVEDEQQQKSEGYIFYAMGRNEFHFKVGGVIIPMTIDSGADANIISADSWKQMKEAGVKVLSMSKQSDRVLRAYASKDVLPVVGMFQAEVAAGQNQTTATFYVVTGDKQCLLGESTARELQVLKIGFDIAAIKTPRTTFPKIKGVVAEISIDETVQPVQQPYRRAPFALEELIEKKLTYLLEQDIIERVNQPSRWVSPLVPVMKDSGDVRLCVDMRRANRAVIQEKHPLPVIDDLLGSINGAVRFSKLDVKDAYHQVELSERSREITTFITKYGLFR